MSNILSKCKSINLNCVFQYQNSTKSKDTALRQSLASGSDVAVNTTISIILSNGKAPSVSNNTSSNTSNNNNNQSNNTQKEEVKCDVKTITPDELNIRELNNILTNVKSYDDTVSKIKSFFQKRNISVEFKPEYNSNAVSGKYISGLTENGNFINFTTCCPNNCKTYSITIAK